MKYILAARLAPDSASQNQPLQPMPADTTANIQHNVVSNPSHYTASPAGGEGQNETNQQSVASAVTPFVPAGTNRSSLGILIAVVVAIAAIFAIVKFYGRK